MQSRLQPRVHDRHSAGLKKNGPVDTSTRGTLPSTISIEAIETAARQITAEERLRRSSLIPQRSASTKVKRDVGLRRGPPSADTPVRTFSGPKAGVGLRTEGSNVKIQQLRQPVAVAREAQGGFGQLGSVAREPLAGFGQVVSITEKPQPGFARAVSITEKPQSSSTQPLSITQKPQPNSTQQITDKNINSSASTDQPSITRDDDASSDSQSHQATRSTTTNGAASPRSEEGPGQIIVEDGMTLRSDRRLGSKPPVSVHRRQNSVPQTPAGITSVGPREHLLTGQGRLRSTEPVKSTPIPPANKPTFSALQQHFTPKRIVQGTVASFSSKLQAEQEVIERAVRERDELKLELLHLHMLHRDSLKVQRQWECSAEDCYRIRFESLSLAHMALTARESEFQEQVNATALIAWGSGKDGFTMERKVQVLSRILSEIWDLSEPNGKYSCLLESFEHWYGRASKVRQLQTPTVSRIESLSAVEGIGDGWKAEVSLLRSKMRTFQEQLQKLGEVQPKSELARCVEALVTMVRNMLDELDIVQEIESELVAQGEAWVKESIDRLTADVTYGMGGSLGPPYVTSSARERARHVIG